MDFSPAFIVLILTVALIGGSVADIPIGGSESITKDHILSVLRNRDASLDKVRNPTTQLGAQSKESTRNYLKTQLSGIAAQADGTLEQQFYNTSIYRDASGNQMEVEAVNYIVVYKGSKKESEDQPLLIIANYDTESSEKNPVDDNASGVVALIVIADVLAKDIKNNRIKLQNSVIIVASDTALGKDVNEAPSGAKVGAGEISRTWLPNFMNGRKSFRGAIVLDNIMNYNDTARSETRGDFSKSFPSAYTEMAKTEFAGDFLALVYREDDLDKPLMTAFEKSWSKTMKQMKGKDVFNDDPRLIKFPFTGDLKNSETELHFSKSDQTEFWSHHVRTESKMYPAILLTDTEHYRASSCPNSGVCPLDRMTTEQNVDFMKRVIMSVYETSVLLQANKSSSSTIPTLSVLTIFAGILLRSLHSFNL